MSVCPSVCLSVRWHNLKTARPNFKILCMLPVAVARSSSDGVAVGLYYVGLLAVLQITSYFHTMGPIGRIKQDVMFRRVRRWQYQLDVMQTSTVLG